MFSFFGNKKGSPTKGEFGPTKADLEAAGFEPPRIDELAARAAAAARLGKRQQRQGLDC